MSKHEKEAHSIIRELAQIDLAQTQDFNAFGDLVKRARVLEEHLPPIMHDADQVKHHDDYLAVRQVAIAIGRDGRLHTSQRTDSPIEYMIPLMAGSRFKQQQDERELGVTLKLHDAQLEDALKAIADGLETEDFQQRWNTVKDKIPASAGGSQGGSRTTKPSNIIVPGRPDLSG